jgi:hypothetical protein
MKIKVQDFVLIPMVEKDKFISQNSGFFGKYSNKCFILAINEILNFDEDYLSQLVKMLKMNDHEEFDTDKHMKELQNIADLHAINISFHTIFLSNVIEISLKSLNVFGDFMVQNPQTTIHIAWYGNHFELIKWDEVSKLLN